MWDFFLMREREMVTGHVLGNTDWLFLFPQNSGKIVWGTKLYLTLLYPLLASKVTLSFSILCLEVLQQYIYQTAFNSGNWKKCIGIHWISYLQVWRKITSILRWRWLWYKCFPLPCTTSFSIPFIFLPLIKYCVLVLIWMSRSITNRKKLLPPANTFSY